MKHLMDLAQGLYRPEILAALKQPKAEWFNFQHFHKGARVSKRFLEPFHIAYDTVVGVPKGRSQEAANSAQPAAATADDATHVGEELVSEKKKKTMSRRSR